MNFNELIRNKALAAKMNKEIAELRNKLNDLISEKRELVEPIATEIAIAEQNRNHLMQEVFADMVEDIPYTATQIHNMYMEKNPKDINFSTKRVYMFTKEGQEMIKEQVKKMYAKSPAGQLCTSYVPYVFIHEVCISNFVRKNIGTDKNPKYRYFKEV